MLYSKNKGINKTIILLKRIEKKIVLTKSLKFNSIFYILYGVKFYDGNKYFIAKYVDEGSKTKCGLSIVATGDPPYQEMSPGNFFQKG